MIPTTKDASSVLYKMYDRKVLDEIPYEEQIDSFKEELFQYLLDKLMYFKLECVNYTIDNDINLLIDTIDEKLPNFVSKYNFFYYINDLIMKATSVIENIYIVWMPLNNPKLLNEHISEVNEDGSCVIYTYIKDYPANITKFLLKQLMDRKLKIEEENTHTSLLVQ